MTAEPDETGKIIQTALDALNRGDKQTAKRLAEQAASMAPGSIAPWLILAALSDPSESLAYVEKALQIDPESKAAREAFAWALRRQGLPPMEPKPETPRGRVVPAFLPESSDEPVPKAFKSKPKPSLEPIHQPIEPKPEPSQERISLPAQPLSPLRAPVLPAQSELRDRQRRKTSFSLRRFGLTIFLGAGILVLIAGLIFLWPRLSGVIARLVNPVPTPRCVQPMLKIGKTQWPIKLISRAVGGSVPIPEQAENAYWLDGTTINYIFEINPMTTGATSLVNINPGDAITITWADCTTDEYVVSTISSDVRIDPSVFDQTHGGVSILIPMNPSTASLLIQGVHPETLTPISTEPVDANSIQAEISFLDQTTSSDGKTLTLTITIQNTGVNSITVAGNDISLTEQNAPPMPPLSVDPGLPQEIAPGKSQTLILTFSKPAGNTAVFKILDFTVDLHF